MADKVRFTVSFNGQPRSILRAQLKKNGRVILNPRHARYSRPDPALNFSDARITDQHYSIHPPNPGGGNLLHLTVDTDKRRKAWEAHQYTQAILAKKFAPLCILQFADLSGEEYADSDGAKSITLGPIDTRHYTLFCGIFIGSANQPFVREDPLADTNLIEHILGNVRLVIVWSFLSIGSLNTGSSMHFLTTKDVATSTEGQIEWMRDLSAGADAMNAMAWWDVYRNLFADRFKTLVSAETRSTEALAKIQTAKFMNVGILIK
jgi:hypothetical protein